MTDTAVKDEIEYVVLADLKVRDDQKYRLENKDEIKALAASIDDVGIIHSLVVDQDGFIASGTRRFGGLTLLKWDRQIPVRRVSKEIADAIVLAANSTTELPDPLHESALVQSMVDKGWTLRDIATTMGWDVRRVALLRQLQNLGPEAKKALEDDGHYMRTWPYDWIEEFASLSPEAQKEALDTQRFQYVRDKSQFDAILSRFFHLLGKAPWDLADETLVPEAGSCTACPKHSGSTPFLFDELEEKDVKKFVCQDATCWLKKANACVGAKIAKLREKNPDSIVVADDAAKASMPALREHPTYRDFQVTPCLKSEKGAVPAIMIRGDTIEQKYVRKPVETAAPQRAPRAPKQELSPAAKEKQRQEKLEARRRQWVVNHMIERLGDWDNKTAPATEIVLGLAAAYPVVRPLTATGEPRDLHGNAKARKELFALAKNEGKLQVALWDRLRPSLIDSIRPLARSGELLDEEYEEALWIADLLGLGTESTFRVLAEQAIPTPKGMQPKAPKAAKKVAKPKAAKKTPKAAKSKKAAPKRKNRAEDGFQPEK